VEFQEKDMNYLKEKIKEIGNRERTKISEILYKHK